MLPEKIISFIGQPYFVVFAGMLAAYLLSVKLFPTLIQISIQKNLVEGFEARKVHLSQVSNLGGVGIFVVYVVLTMTLFTFIELTPESFKRRPSWIAGLTIVFFLGLKDDLIGLSPNKKFLGQLTAVFIVVAGAGLRIYSLDGIFGVYELPFYVSILFSFFVFLLLINAFNLIDGIDGLAGSVALFGSLIFGLFFLNMGQINYAVSSFVLAGALLGFLQFNFSAIKKIFMGDSGSMVLGFLMAGQAILFLNESGKTPELFTNTPVIVLAILSFPLLDTLRVFILRTLKGGSPFLPDNKHLHHILLRLGLSHKQSTAILLLQTLLVFTLAYLTQNFDVNTQLLLVVGIGINIYLIPILSFNRLHRQFTNWYMNIFESETP